MNHTLSVLALIFIGMVWGFVSACWMLIRASYKKEFWDSFFYMADIQKIATVLKAFVHRWDESEKDEKK